MIVGVPKESFPGERRVALVPQVIPNLAKAGMEVVIRGGRGGRSRLSGRRLCSKRARKSFPTVRPCFAQADIIVQVLCYGSNDRTGKADIPLLAPRSASDRISASAGLEGNSAGDRGDRA